jgi:hypothetical protein
MEKVAPSPNVLFPRCLARWHAQGLSFRAAAAVTHANCDTADEVARLGRDYFEGRRNCSTVTMQALATLANWPSKRQTAVDAIATALAMAIADPAEAREAATDAVIALRRSGYVLSARRTEART